MSDMFPFDPESLDNAFSEEESTGVAEDLAIQLDATQINGSKETAIRAGQIATIKGAPTDRVILEKAKSETNAVAATDRAAQERYDDLIRQNEEYLKGVQDNTVTPEMVAPYLQQGVEQRVAITEERAKPTATERAVIEAIQVEADEQLRQEKEFQLAARNEVSAMLDSQGLLESVLDFSSYLVPFGEFKDIIDAKEVIGQTAGLEELSGGSIESMVASFQALPPARKQAVWPTLSQAIIEATSTDFGVFKTDGNLTKAAGILLNFLAPEGGEELQDVATLDLVLGAAEFIPAKKLAQLGKLSKATKADMEAVIKQTAHNINRKANVVKTTKELGNGKQAAKVNMEAAVDESVAEAAGINTQLARDNFIPQNPDAFTPEKAKGLSVDLQEELNEFIFKAEGQTRAITTESELVQIGALDASERKYAVDNFLRRMAKNAEDLQSEGISLTNMEVISVDSKGVTFSYDMVNTKERVAAKITDKATGVESTIHLQHAPKRHTGRVSWKVNDVTGLYEETVESLTANLSTTKALSPSAFSKVGGKQGDFGDEVRRAIQVSDLSAAVEQKVGDLWKEANRDIKLSRKTNLLLDKIELEGDEFINPDTHVRGRVFTTNELSERGLTDPKAQQAYYKRRIVADQLHAIQNYATRRELELGGFGSTRVNGREVIAKMYDTPEAASASLRSNKRKGLRVYRQAEGETAVLTEDMIREEYAKGRRLVRARKDFNTQAPNDEVVKGEFVEYIFINDQKRMKTLPERVVGYHQGYVPKIQEGVEFVVRSVQKVNKVGDPDAGVRSALRAFSSRKEAQEFIRQLVVDRAAKANLSPEDAAKLLDEYEIANNSEMTQFERMEGAVSSGNGLFTGARAQGELLRGLKGEPIERMSPTAAFSRYANQIGRVIGRNEWRVGAEKRWVNTVRKLVSQGKLGKTQVRGFNDTNLPDTPEGKALAALREQINVWNGQLSKEESLWQREIQSLHDWVLDSKALNKLGVNEKLAPPILKLKHTNPAGLLKNANMHAYLGIFNPAQLYVQASAAAMSTSLLPNLGDLARHVPRLISWSHLDLTKNAEGVSNLTKALTKAGLMSAEDADMYKLWTRSGLRESVRNNADMAFLESSGLHPVKDTIKGVLDRGLFLYRQGEMVNRRSAFISAARRLQEKTGKKFSAFNDDDLQAVLADANKMMLELNSANRAWWQGGQGTGLARQTLGVASQFMQVTAKTMELAFKGTSRGGFTQREKLRILFGQGVVFGAVGVPFVNLLAPAIADLTGASESPEMVNIINQGLSGAVMTMLTGGAEVDVAARASLLAGVVQTVHDLAFSKDENWTLLAGVSAETATRGVTAMEELWDVGASLAPLFLGDVRGFDMTRAEMEQALYAIGSIPSSGKNLLKAYMMANQDRILDRRGIPVVQDEFDMGEVMATAFGFRLTDETRTRMTQLDNRDFEDLVDETAQSIIDMHHNWVYRYDRDPAHGKLLLHKRQLILEGLDNEELIRRVNERVERRIFRDTKSIQEREMRKFWERTVPDEIEGKLFSERSSFGSAVLRASEQPITQPLAGLNEEE